MRWWAIFGLRLRTLLRRRRVEAEMDKELRFHFDQQVEENLARGMTPVAARQAALSGFGVVAQIQEDCRDMRRTSYLENFWQDLRYTARTLGKSPGFAIIIVLTLALSIGANSAIFSVIHGVLLRPLPYPNADRLVRIFFSSRTFPKFPLNPLDFRDIRARSRSFEVLAASTRADLQISGVGEPVKLTGMRVTAGYFRVLGIPPARGREFDTNDELPANGRQVILSDRVWRNILAAAPDIVGRTIQLNAQPFTVAAVMPPEVTHPGNEYQPVGQGDTVDIWIPFTYQANSQNRGSHYIEAIGRLSAGVTTERAQQEMNAQVAQLAREHTQAVGWKPLVVSLYQEIVGPSRRMLLVLLGAVGLVLLIACANAANLLLARATARQREIAVRSALGAGRARLVRQMFAESLLIALVGGGLGAAIAVEGVRVLVSLLPAGFPRASAIHVNAAVLGFTLLLTVGTGFLFGLAPALQASRADLQQALRETGRGSTGGRGQLRLRNVLVVAEVALACTLLIGAGLMLRSFVNLLRADPGFRPQHVLTASLSLPDKEYPKAAIPRFYEQLLADLRSLPGVEAAGAGTDLPWTGYDDNFGGLTIEGKQPPPGQSFHGRYHVASADYFTAMGTPLLQGRVFDGRDKAGAHPVLLINRAMAQECWPNEDPVGKRLSFDDNPKESDWMTVVGVVGDVKDQPNRPAAEPAFWWPMLQMPWSFPSLSVVVRSTGDTAALGNQVRSSVHRLNPSLAVADIRTMDQITDASISTPRFALFLVALFAGLALTLAAIGIYGVISYSVGQRMPEFGMRIALGAGAWDVMRLVLTQGLQLGLIGVAAGVVCALALAQVLGTLLYEVSSRDPLTFGAVSLGAIFVATLACYIPARKAVAADPMQALRAE
jgi:predicted permease